jgi:hypothetical protein
MHQSKYARRVGASRRALTLAVAMAALGVLGLLSGFAGRAIAKEPKAMLMFVQIADDVRVDAASQTLRLVNVGQQTLYFADRPERIAGHIKMADFLAEWTSKAGNNNFGSDPPNATLSVFETGKPSDTLAVVKISKPKVEGPDLVYNYKLIEGTLPATGGATSLFIDWIGRGGAAGFGYRGVGVGYRGRGWR